MAVTQQNSYRKFFGTAAERAAFDEVLLGDKFFETDTGLMKVWDGAAFVADAEDVLTLAAGAAIIGKVGIDQATANANQVVTKTGSVTTATLAAGTAIAGQFGIDQTTDGTTNKVQARNATHDNFNANANLQVGDADVTYNNPIPVAGGVDSGLAASGGSKTTLVADSKDYEVDALANMLVKFTLGGITYVRFIISNTDDTLTFATLPGAVATAVVGAVEAGQVTVTVDAEGADANDYTLELVAGVGAEVPLSAAFNDGVLTVTLPTDENGDPAAATANEVASEIDDLDGFSAAMTGFGGNMDPTVSPIAFTGGVDTVVPVEGTAFVVSLPA